MTDHLLHPTSRTVATAYEVHHYCPVCKRRVHGWISHGRWDAERQATAIPFDHVATTFKHSEDFRHFGDRDNCVTGDYAASQPTEGDA